MKGRGVFFALRMVSLLVPALVLLALNLVTKNSGILPGALLTAHLLTLGWVVLVVTKKFCKATFLPLSFLASPALSFLVEREGSGPFANLATTLLYFLYGLPWAIITFVLAAVLLVRSRMKRRKEIHYELYTDEEER